MRVGAWSRAVLIVGPLAFFFSSAAAGEARYVPDQLLVQFRADTTTSAVAEVNTLLGAGVEHRYRLLPNLRLIKLPKGSSVEAAIKYYMAQPEVIYAEPDYIGKDQGSPVIPNDPLFVEQWGMHNTGQDGGEPDFDIDAPEAWVDQPVLSPIVAIIDTGVERDHEDLEKNLWENIDEVRGRRGYDDDHNGYIDDYYGWDFVDDDNTPNVYGNGFEPLDGHGVHIAGVVAAKGGNAKGVAGVNWNARIMDLRVSGSPSAAPTMSRVLEALEYAIDNGARVTNHSHVFENCTLANYDDLTALYQMIELANERGVLVVAAAGNQGDNLEYEQTCFPSFPNENIIAVAAMDRFGNLDNTSNFGETDVDLGAPGIEILSTFTWNDYRHMDGTSMATPFVTGAVSYLMSFPVVMPADPPPHLVIKDLILGSVEPNNSLVDKTVTEGVLNLRNALDALFEQYE